MPEDEESEDEDEELEDEEEEEEKPKQKKAKEEKGPTLDQVLTNHEQRILALEAKLFRLQNA